MVTDSQPQHSPYIQQSQRKQLNCDTGESLACAKYVVVTPNSGYSPSMIQKPPLKSLLFCFIIFLIVGVIDVILFNNNFALIGFISSDNDNMLVTHISDTTNSSENYLRTNTNHPPQIAWLLSFPNSGTTFTLTLVEEASNTTIAKNHGRPEYRRDDEGYSVPVDPQFSNDGPFLFNSQKNPPKNYILTKTHCDGYCTRCSPEEYEQTRQSFRRGCCRGSRTVPLPDGDYDEIKVRYNVSRVKKIVHLIRDPFDNIVSRFHMVFKKAQHKNDTAWISSHPNDAHGFHTWCHEIDNLHLTTERSFYGHDAWNDALAVPCHAEFYRYIQWHNRAFEVTQRLSVPSLIVHYEDYRNDWNVTVEELFGFLELEIVEELVEFIWKGYDDYYSKEERDAAILWMIRYASEETVDRILKYYFDS